MHPGPAQRARNGRGEGKRRIKKIEKNKGEGRRAKLESGRDSPSFHESSCKRIFIISSASRPSTYEIRLSAPTARSRPYGKSLMRFLAGSHPPPRALEISVRGLGATTLREFATKASCLRPSPQRTRPISLRTKHARTKRTWKKNYPLVEFYSLREFS